MYKTHRLHLLHDQTFRQCMNYTVKVLDTNQSY